MNVDLHAITLRPTNNSRNNDQRLLSHKVPDASLLLDVLLARVRRDVELQGIGDAEEEQKAAERLQKGSWESHGDCDSARGC